MGYLELLRLLLCIPAPSLEVPGHLFVFLNGFDQTVQNIVATFQGMGIAVVPIVRPDQAESFEEFAFERIPADGGYSTFGRGIWATDPTNATNPHYQDK